MGDGVAMALLIVLNCGTLTYGLSLCAPCKKTCLLGLKEVKYNSPCSEKCECRKDSSGFLDDMKLDTNVKNYLIKHMGTDDDLVPEPMPEGVFSDAGREGYVLRWEYPALQTKWEIPYVIGNVSSDMRSLINEAIADYETYICMDFVERTTEPRYLHFMDDGTTGCWSFVGRRSDGVNYINLHSSQCLVKGTVIHEILHSMGFFHEHQRPDRDDYIVIEESAIDPTYLNNFLKLDYNAVDRFISTAVAYDIGSVMQYYDNAFSLRGSKTISDIHGNGLNVQRDGFANSDILQLQLMYQCDGLNLTIPTSTSNAANPLHSFTTFLSAFTTTLYLTTL